MVLFFMFIVIEIVLSMADNNGGLLGCQNQSPAAAKKIVTKWAGYLFEIDSNSTLMSWWYAPLYQ